MPNELFDFQTKKSLHINLKKETHAGFRIALFKKRLTMQEAIEEFANLVALENPRALTILENLVEKKRNHEVERLSETDAEEIYKMLAEDGPLS